MNTGALPSHSDDVEEELGRIRLALDAVYGSQHPSHPSANAASSDPVWYQQRQLANGYLTSFQNTAIAWVVCDRLLWEDSQQQPQTPENSMKQQQRHFFAAQTLLTKCRADHDVQQLLQQESSQPQPSTARDGTALPATASSQVLLSLRDSLLQHLNRAISTKAGVNTALATRLAMAISALAVQMGWFTIIPDLLSMSSEDPSHHQTILFLLRALPEECASDRLLLLDDNHRFVMRDHYIHTSPTVFAFFLHHLSSSATSSSTDPLFNAPNTHRVLQAWYAWIRYVPIRPHVIAESPLLPATVQILIASATSVPSLDILEQAADVVVEILRMYPSHGPPDNQCLVQQMLTLLSKLPLPQVLADSKQEDDITSDRNHIVRDYCRIVTEMGESYLHWILWALGVATPGGGGGASPSFPSSTPTPTPHEKEAAFHLVDWILLCSSSVSDIDITGMTLHFWYGLVLELEQTEPYEWRQELVDALSTRLLQFVNVAALNLIKFPSDIGEMAEDQVEDINRHRYYVSETVEDCCRLLGGQTVLLRIAELLQEQVLRGKVVNQTIDYHRLLHQEWQTLESCLSCLVAIHMFVPEDDQQFLPFVFEQLVPGLASAAAPPNETASSSSAAVPMPPPLRFTVCKVIGKFARWLATRSRSNPNLMPPLLPFLAQGLSVTECAPAAAVAIKELCSESHPHSFAIGQPVLELYEQVAAASSSSDVGTTLGRPPLCLNLRDELPLLEGVCLALSKHIQMDPASCQNGSAFLQRLVQPIGTRLANNLSSSSSTPRTVLPDIQRLAVVVQYLKVLMDMSLGGAHPVVELMQSLWSFLETLIVRFPNDNNTAEQVCRLHKHALRSCGVAAYRPMLTPLMRYLVEGYDRCHQSPFLYAASVCVSEYGGSNLPAPPASSASGTTTLTTQQELYGMVEAMSNTTFRFMRNLDDFNNHPDVVEELFYLMERMMLHCSNTLLTANPPTMLQSLVQVAVLCMNLDHHGAHKGTMTFLDCLLSSKVLVVESNNAEMQQKRSTLEQVLGQEGGGMLHNLVRALVGDLPSYSPKIPELLWKFKRVFGKSGMLTQWVSAALSPDAATSASGSTNVLLLLSDQLKHEFMGAVVSTDLPKEDFLLALRAFQNASNRHRRHLQQRRSELST